MLYFQFSLVLKRVGCWDRGNERCRENLMGDQRLFLWIFFFWFSKMRVVIKNLWRKNITMLEKRKGQILFTRANLAPLGNGKKVIWFNYGRWYQEWCMRVLDPDRVSVCCFCLFMFSTLHFLMFLGVQFLCIWCVPQYYTHYTWSAGNHSFYILVAALSSWEIQFPFKSLGKQTF